MNSLCSKLLYSRYNRINGPNELSPTARTTSNSLSARSSQNSVNGRCARLPIHFGLNPARRTYIASQRMRVRSRYRSPDLSVGCPPLCRPMEWGYSSPIAADRLHRVHCVPGRDYPYIMAAIGGIRRCATSGACVRVGRAIPELRIVASWMLAGRRGSGR